MYQLTKSENRSFISNSIFKNTMTYGYIENLTKQQSLSLTTKNLINRINELESEKLNHFETMLTPLTITIKKTTSIGSTLDPIMKAGQIISDLPYTVNT